MPIIKIEIKNYKECSHFKTANEWNSDGWDKMVDWICTKADKRYKEVLNGMKKIKFKYPIGVL